MKKNKISLIGAVLGIISSSCAFLISLSYMIEASVKSLFIFKYCSSMTFFISIALITLFSILTYKLDKKFDKATFKILKNVNVVFSIILILLLASQFFIYDYNTGAFGVTFTSIIIILLIVSIIFVCNGGKNYEEIDIEKELETLKNLLDKGYITQQEYEIKRKIIVSKL